MLASLLKRLLPRRFGFGGARFADVYALYQRGDLARADRECAAIRDTPRPDVQFLHGLIAQKRGDLVRAAVLMTSAVEARTEEPAFRLGLGQVLLELNQAATALEHLDLMLADATLDTPSRVSALRDAARCHLALGSFARALEHFGKALELAPGDPAVCNLLSTALFAEARADDARAALEPLVRAGVAGMRLRRALFLPSVYESQADIDEVRERLSRELDELLASPQAPVEDPAEQIGMPPFFLAYHNRNNVALLEKLCRASRAVYRLPPPRPLSRPRRSRLRVGFVSTYFRMHSVGRVTLGLIRDLPRDRFSVYVFAVTPGEDAMRGEIERAADHYRALPAVLEEVRRTIEDAELDVLVFADIGMHALTYYLALSRLAPIQAVWWGHPETTGIDTIDYFLSADAVEVEHAQAHYTERLARPPAFFLPGYERPVLERPMSREALGLPDRTRLYACLQPVFKLHPDMDAVLAGVLERDREGEIILLEGTPAGAALVRRRLERACGANASRIRIIRNMPVQKYLATLAAADVSLDPLYFGGGNSSCDAIAVGVPLVALPGEHLYGRLTFGLYREMGIDQGIVSSPDEYIEVACRIAGDTALRSAISSDLAAREHVLYGRKDITLAYADFFEEAVAARS